MNLEGIAQGIVGFIGGAALLLSLAGCPAATPKPANNIPKITSTPVESVYEKQAYNYPVTATDADNAKLIYSLPRNPGWLAIDSSTGVLSGTAPRIKYETVYPATVQVSDGTDAVTQDINITVKDVFDYTVSSGQSIQGVIDAAPAGSKIAVSEGNYTENLKVNKKVSIIGFGNTYIASANGTPVVTVSASGDSNEFPLFLKNLKIHTKDSAPISDTGIMISGGAPLSCIELEDIVVTGNNHAYPGLESGVSLAAGTSLSGFVINNSYFKDLSYGIIAGAITSTNPGYFKNVEIKNTVLEHNSVKGFYAERLSDAVFENVTAKNNGNILLSPSWADPWNSGIDINLKYGTYQNITLKNLTVTGNGIGHAQGSGLTIKARGTGNDPSYISSPAALTHVVIDGGTFTGNNVSNDASDIRFGEIGKNNTSPTDIVMKNSPQYNRLINALNGVSISQQ